MMTNEKNAEMGRLLAQLDQLMEGCECISKNATRTPVTDANGELRYTAVTVHLEYREPAAPGEAAAHPAISQRWDDQVAAAKEMMRKDALRAFDPHAAANIGVKNKRPLVLYIDPPKGEFGRHAMEAMLKNLGGELGDRVVIAIPIHDHEKRFLMSQNDRLRRLLERVTMGDKQLLTEIREALSPEGAKSVPLVVMDEAAGVPDGVFDRIADLACDAAWYGKAKIDVPEVSDEAKKFVEKFVDTTNAMRRFDVNDFCVVRSQYGDYIPGVVVKIGDWISHVRLNEGSTIAADNDRIYRIKQDVVLKREAMGAPIASGKWEMPGGDIKADLRKAAEMINAATNSCVKANGIPNEIVDHVAAEIEKRTLGEVISDRTGSVVDSFRREGQQENKYVQVSTTIADPEETLPEPDQGSPKPEQAPRTLEVGTIARHTDGRLMTVEAIEEDGVRCRYTKASGLIAREKVPADALTPE